MDNRHYEPIQAPLLQSSEVNPSRPHHGGKYIVLPLCFLAILVVTFVTIWERPISTFDESLELLSALPETYTHEDTTSTMEKRIPTGHCASATYCRARIIATNVNGAVEVTAGYLIYPRKNKDVAVQKNTKRNIKRMKRAQAEKLAAQLIEALEMDMPEAVGKISVDEVADALMDAKIIAAKCKHTSRDECHPSEVVGEFVIPSPSPSPSPTPSATPSVTPSASPSPSPAALGECPMIDANDARCQEFLLNPSKSTLVSSDEILGKLEENNCDVTYSRNTRIEIRTPVCVPSCPNKGACNPVIGKLVVQSGDDDPQCTGPLFGPAYRFVFGDGLPACQDLDHERYTPWDEIWMSYFYSPRNPKPLSDDLRLTMGFCRGSLKYIFLMIEEEIESLVDKACSLAGI